MVIMFSNKPLIEKKDKMKHYTVKEYLKRYSQTAEQKQMDAYLLSLAKGADLAEMIEFKEPDFLAGAFAGKFGFLSITNHLNGKGKELKTQAENLASYVSYSEGVYSFDNLIKPKELNGVFLTGCYDKKTGKPLAQEARGDNVYRFFVESLDERTSTLAHPYLEKKEFSRSEVRNSDVLRGVLDALKSNKAEDVIFAIEQTLLTMDKKTKGFFDYDVDAYPTYEKPYKVYVAGNDDSSWSMCYATMEEARTVRAAILAEPTQEMIDKYLVFTN